MSVDRSQYNREWYAKNRERRLVEMKKNYELNKVQRRKKKLEWYYENREISLKRMREYWKANRETLLPRKRERNRRNYELNREEVLRRTEVSRLKHKYGLTPSRYKELSKRQNNMCKICNIKCKRLYIDHKIKGSFRGLLCACCNSGLGMFRDSIYNLKSAIRYLKAA